MRHAVRPEYEGLRALFARKPLHPSAGLLPAIDTATRRGLNAGATVLSHKGKAKRECGEGNKPNSAAVPATVSDEPSADCHWAETRSGKAARRRRPASQETCRRKQSSSKPGGCPGRGDRRWNSSAIFQNMARLTQPSRALAIRPA